MKTMFERYHIEVKDAPSKIKLPPKFTIKRYNNCLNVQECVQACIYEAHKIQDDGQIANPVEDLCRGCHLCTLACPKGAISVGINPKFAELGNSYFNPERMETIYFEAETGRVPVSGTGYKGAFSGRGFDGIWFDFSEIVRPTRDGIHGREYISTAVDLGKRLQYLEFDGNGNVLSNPPRTLEIPIPMILDAPLESSFGRSLQLALAKAANRLNTFAIVNAKEFSAELATYRANLIPRIHSREIGQFNNLVKTSRIIEVDVEEDEAQERAREIKEINPSALVSLHFPFDNKSGERAEDFARAGADIIHFYANEATLEQNPDTIVNAIRSTHSHLVDRVIRDKVTFISSGGIAEAAHIPKSIILGADAVSIGLTYQIALGCKVCYGEKHAEDCPIKVENEDIELAAQRIVNLIGSWRDQLLEVLSGMGLREVRRQRGEMGRAMFYNDLEAKVFGDGE